MTDSARGDLPLAGVRIVDLTAIVLGPLATLCLADLGADVIKVEPPEGDGVRNAGQSQVPGMGSIFVALNRNKRSIALDLKSPSALSVLERLAIWADVIVHNMRPDAARKLGLVYESLSAANPRLIFCSASGFAAGSDRADDPAVDDVIQAASGLASLFARNGGEPRYVPGLIADKVTGLFTSQAILAALLKRERTGRGQSINVPMAETMAAFTLAEHMGGAAFEPQAGPTGYGRLLTPHRKPMPTSDGHIAMTPYSKRHWQAFFTAAGRQDLVDDPRVTDPVRRNAEIGDLYALLGAIVVLRPTSFWLAVARKEGLPAAPVSGLDELIADQGLRKAGYVRQVCDAAGNHTIAVRFMDDSLARQDLTPAPLLGEHGREILAQIGFGNEEIETLVSGGAVRV